jgi:hypothetical protein
MKKKTKITDETILNLAMVKELVIEYGDRYWSKRIAQDVITHIEDGLKIRSENEKDSGLLPRQ